MTFDRHGHKLNFSPSNYTGVITSSPVEYPAISVCYYMCVRSTNDAASVVQHFYVVNKNNSKFDELDNSLVHKHPHLREKVRELVPHPAPQDHMTDSFQLRRHTVYARLFTAVANLYQYLELSSISERLATPYRTAMLMGKGNSLMPRSISSIVPL